MELYSAAEVGPSSFASGTTERERVGQAMMPPLNRTPMAPQPWSHHRKKIKRDRAARGRWHRIALLRRSCLFGLVLAQTWIATSFMASVLPYQGRQLVEIAILILFAILFGWISAGFWTAMTGLLVLWFGGDRHAISATAPSDAPIADGVRTAIVMPIYNEYVA